MSIKRNRLELSSELGKHILSVKAFRDYLNNFLDSEIKDPQEILKLSSISTEYLSNYLRPTIATSPCHDESDDDKDSIFKLFDDSDDDIDPRLAEFIDDNKSVSSVESSKSSKSSKSDDFSKVRKMFLQQQRRASNLEIVVKDFANNNFDISKVILYNKNKEPLERSRHFINRSLIY
jgi:hypothetical protein